MIKYPNLDLLRYKKYQSLCDAWVVENFGYWGDAPLWATRALDNLGRMQEKYGYSRIIQGKLEIPSRWEGGIPCFCVKRRSQKEEYDLKRKINRERVKRGLNTLEYIVRLGV